MQLGRLLFPALRFDGEHGFEGQQERIDAGLTHGVGGFILFGGDAGAVRELTTSLQERSAHPLLIGADLERGAGQQFRGATSLPPAAALGELDDVDATRRAAELTAREARAVGVNWVYAPVADLDIEARNPIVGSRAFGADPVRVARHVAAWIEGCRAGGGLSCAKHFPGHGRTVSDSHLELPRVEGVRTDIDADLTPFRAAVETGADSMMTAHVAYPALDPSGAPATLSRRIVGDLLRDALGFDGLVVTDALIMEGVLEGGGGEGTAAVRALAAGCDALLYPQNLDAVGAAIDAALGRDVPNVRGEDAVRRIDRAARRVARAPEGEWAREEDRAWALEIATRSLRAARGRPALPADAVDVITIDDDVGGPYAPPSRDRFPAALRAAGVDVTDAAEATPERGAVVAVYADIRAWKGRPGISKVARESVARALTVRPDAPIVLFGSPRLAGELPGTAILAAWGGEALMQEAAGRALAGSRDTA